MENSRSTMSRIENGRVPVTSRDVRDLLDIYGTADAAQRAALVQLAREAKHRGWWVEYESLLPGRESTYLEFEAEAAKIRAYHLRVVDGLLQTDAYARAIIAAVRPTASADDVEQLVSLRSRRHDDLLIERQPKLVLWTILDEATLRRPVGDPDVMDEQLQRIIDVGAMPNVTVQAMPFGKGAHAGLRGDFTILDSLDEGDSPTAHSEGPTSSVWIQEPEELHQLGHMFDHLRATALSPTETVSFLRTIMEEPK